MSIWAKVEVSLAEHHRSLRIPVGFRAECLGVWLVALLWTRGHDRDGFCPLEAFHQVARAKIIDELVRVDLLSREVDEDGVHGVRVLRYELFNESKSEVDRRKARDRERKSTPKRRQIPGGILSDSSRIPVEGVPGFPVSDSDSVSDLRSQISEQLLRHERNAVATVAPDDIPVTEAIRTQCATAGARPPTTSDVRACLANAREKGHVRADWGAALVSWMIRAKQFERDRPTHPEGLPLDAPARRKILPLPTPKDRAQ